MDNLVYHRAMGIKTKAAVTKVSFDRVIDLFLKTSKNRFILAPSVGTGYVQIFELEKGLQARFWDCSFNQEILLYNETDAEAEHAYFTLAFFLHIRELQFYNKGSFLPENAIWDTIFIPASSHYKIHISPNAECHCLSISFSKRWLTTNLFQNNKAFKDLEEKINASISFSLLQSMSVSEKKMIQELLDASWKRSLGSFYIKSGVLRVICDFFYKIRQKDVYSTNNPCIDISLTEVERCLTCDLTAPMPNLKDMAHRFSMSESTLKRHFKIKFGVNMSAYFMMKRMEYAQQLMRESNASVNETASLLGYKNVNNFISMLRKYPYS